MAAGLGTLGAAAAPVGGAGPAAPGAATASPGAAGRTGARLCRRVMSDWAKALAPKAQEFLGNAQFLVLFQKNASHQSTQVGSFCWPSPSNRIMWRCPGILETFQGLFCNLGGSTPIKGPMHRPCTSNWLKSWWHSSYMLIYKEPLLTHLLVSVPSILALRYLPMLHPQIATTKLHSKTHWRRCEKHAPSSIQLEGWWTSISTRQQLCLAPRGEQKYWLARALPHLEHLSSSKCPPVEKDWYLKPFRSEIFTLSMKMDVHLVRLDPMWAKNLHFVISCLWNLEVIPPTTPP